MAVFGNAPLPAAMSRPELRFPDANFEKDVPATRILLDAGIPLVFAGYEASSDVWLTRAHLDAVAGRGANGAWIRDESLAWLERWEGVLKLRGFTEGPDDRVGDGPAATRATKAFLVCEPAADADASHE